MYWAYVRIFIEYVILIMKEVLFFTEVVDYPSFFSVVSTSKWLDVIAKYYSKRIGDLSFIFCDDEYILQVNRQYLQHDYYTDVITFDYCKKKILSGDVFISLDTVKSNAEQFSTGYEDELYRVICHAILHLIGFKDKTDADEAEMRLNENICLELLKTI